MIKSLLSNAVVDRIKVSQAAGTGAVTSDPVDMAGYEGALFLVELGAIVSGGTNTCKVQQSSDDGSADAYGDLEGTSLVNSGDEAAEKVQAIEVINPGKRYLKLIATRAAQNVEIDSILVIKFGSRKLPVTQPANVDGSEQHVGPAEGTA